MPVPANAPAWTLSDHDVFVGGDGAGAGMSVVQPLVGDLGGRGALLRLKTRHYSLYKATQYQSHRSARMLSLDV